MGLLWPLPGVGNQRSADHVFVLLRRSGALARRALSSRRRLRCLSSLSARRIFEAQRNRRNDDQLLSFLFVLETSWRLGNKPPRATQEPLIEPQERRRTTQEDPKSVT